MNLKSLLEQLGLSKHAANCYEILMKNGTHSASDLAAKASLNRSSTYSILDELINIGLVTHYDDSGVTKYSAEAPIQLIGLSNSTIFELEKQKASIQEFSNEISTKKQEHIAKPFVKYYEGKEGYLNLLTQCLLTPDQGEVYEITNHELCRKYFLNEIDSYNKKVINKNWTVYSISQGTHRIDKENLKVIPYNDSSIESEVAMFLDFVTFISLTEHPKSFSIQHQDISVTMKSLYKLAIIQ